MKEHNILPYDGHSVLIDDTVSDFDWPAITQALLETIPWRIETARMFGREMPVPRMTAWFGDPTILTAVSIIGRHHSRRSSGASARRPKRYRARHTMPFCSIFIDMAVTVSGGTAIVKPVLEIARQ